MTANPRLAKAQTGVSPQRGKLESHRKGPHWSLTAKAHTGVSPQRREGRQGEQPGEEMEVKFVGLQSRSGFAGGLLLGLPICAFLVRRRIDRAGWSLLGAPGVPHGLQFPDFIR